MRCTGLLVSAVLLIVQAGCAAAPMATPQPNASATAAAPKSSPTALTETPALALTLATATIPPTTVQAAATPSASDQRPTNPPLPTPPAAGSTPPPPTMAARPSATSCGEGAVSPVTSLVVTPDELPVYYLVIGGRLYRSTDRGDAWREEARSGLPSDAYINSVTIDYQHPKTMYAATTQGIYRRQGQEAWGLVNTLKALAVAVDFVNSDVLWAGIYLSSELEAVIAKSEDAGRTWGKADGGTGLGGMAEEILIDPKNPNVLWAVVSPRYSGSAARLYRGGRDGHWEPLDLGAFQQGGDGDRCYPGGIAYDPNAGLLYVGCYPSRPTDKVRLLRSANADAADSRTIRWEAVTASLPEVAQRVEGTRPLAVDAREPRSLLAVASFWKEITCPRYALLVSHDDGAAWETLPLDGLPQAPEQ
ncbi:MAG TPA: hypothetical protein PLJ35_19095 [Anaerolineae bacterium]|nr:hypothetical protein [Anaerolineae bacterium]HPL30214.1 hypothetical protein [Anaerolineae bacterium]